MKYSPGHVPIFFCKVEIDRRTSRLAKRSQSQVKIWSNGVCGKNDFKPRACASQVPRKALARPLQGPCKCLALPLARLYVDRNKISPGRLDNSLFLPRGKRNDEALTVNPDDLESPMGMEHRPSCLF